VQEPEDLRETQDEPDQARTRIGRMLASVTAAGRSARVAVSVVPLAAAGAVVATRRIGFPRRWFGATAVVSLVAVSADVLLMRRRKRAEETAEIEHQRELAQQRHRRRFGSESAF
jgi:hypothetical protein